MLVQGLTASPQSQDLRQDPEPALAPTSTERAATTGIPATEMTVAETNASESATSVG